MKKRRFVKKIISSVLSIIVSASCVSLVVQAYEYGVDISRYQGDISWDELGKSDMKFAILRVGTTKYGEDSRFQEYYSGTRDIGIKTGAYLYVSALTLEEFRESAQVFLKYLDGKEWEMPVYIDLEDNEQTLLGKKKLTTYALAAMNIISDAGYTTGIYSNKNWFTNYLDRELIEKAGYEIWWAQYPGTLVNPLDYDKSDVCGIWQYSSHGKVPGIPYAWVDLNIAYKIYNEKKKEPSEGELWIIPAKLKKSMYAGAGPEYGEIINIPPNTILEVKDKKRIGTALWGRVSFGGFNGWCQLDDMTCIFSEGENDETVFYDINIDGFIDVKDIIDMNKFILSSGAEGSASDINGDGLINILDCQRLRSYIVNINQSANG